MDTDNWGRSFTKKTWYIVLPGEIEQQGDNPPLTSGGRTQMEKAAHYFLEQPIAPTRIYCGVDRASNESLQVFHKALGSPPIRRNDDPAFGNSKRASVYNRRMLYWQHYNPKTGTTHRDITTWPWEKTRKEMQKRLTFLASGSIIILQSWRLMVFGEKERSPFTTRLDYSSGLIYQVTFGGEDNPILTLLTPTSS